MLRVPTSIDTTLSSRWDSHNKTRQSKDWLGSMTETRTFQESGLYTGKGPELYH